MKLPNGNVLILNNNLMNLPTGSRQIWFNNPQHIFFHIRPLCKDSRFISVASKCLQLKFHNVLWLIPETYIIRQWELNWWVPNIGYRSQTHINFNYNPCHYFHDPRGLAYEVFFLYFYYNWESLPHEYINNVLIYWLMTFPRTRIS